MTILTFLRARIDEDEQAARAAKAAPLDTEISGDDVVAQLLVLAVDEGGSPDAAEHLRRHSPDRVLAECVAKRHIIDLIDVGLVERPLSRDMLRAFAKAYDDHPEYASFSH